jgi:cytochrome P450
VTLLDRHSATIIIDGYEAIRQALFDPNLSRTFDRRSYAEGNIRDGIVSISHGAVQRARRRVENTQFRPDRLRLYERELFPKVLDDLLDRLIDGERIDIFSIGELLSVVLAARRAGLDFDETSLDELRDLVRCVDVFSQGAAILDARDPDAVRRLVRQTYDEFDRRWVRPSAERRLSRLDAVASGEADASGRVPHDILTALLQHRADPALELDDGRIVREVATYLQGGTHTSAQTVTNALDLVFAEPDAEALLERIADDLAFAQRVVHETLRLRPTTPKMKRRAEADTVVAGVPIPKDALVILDAGAANRDPAVFGPQADRFDPDRVVDAALPRWGLAFGAGPHQCPGRSVAAGFPAGAAPADDEPAADDHLFGLVALMLRAVAARGVRPDPDASPQRDTRTERSTRWSAYPVRFERPRRPTTSS